MALIKNQEAREIEELQKVEDRIRRSERREKIHHILIAGLGTLLAASLVSHCLGYCKHGRR